MIPTSIPGVLDACRDLLSSLSEADAVRLGEALTVPGGPVQQMAACFGFLAAMEEPSDAALLALVGCARLIAGNGFTGRALDGSLVTPADAAEALYQHGGAIREADARAMPVLPEPGP